MLRLVVLVFSLIGLLRGEDGAVSEIGLYEVVPSRIVMTPNPQDREATFSFEIKNTSSLAIEVRRSDVVAGCGCSRVSFEPSVLPPSGSLRVTGSVDLESINGPTQKSVLIGVADKTKRLKIDIRAMRFSSCENSTITCTRKNIGKPIALNIDGINGYHVDHYEACGGGLEWSIDKDKNGKITASVLALDGTVAGDRYIKLKFYYTAVNQELKLPKKTIILSVIAVDYE